jgi:UrcA family protein
MIHKNRKLVLRQRAVLTVSLLLTTMFGSTTALTAPTQLEKITVWGGVPIQKVVGRSSIAPISQTTLQYHVRYDDLDLATRDGADVLRERVMGAAKSACADLDRMHFSWAKDVSCIRSVERNVRSQVENAIKQAQQVR